jgi:uncharacterized membrane protein YdbT with pleckstrin-like domain
MTRPRGGVATARETRSYLLPSEEVIDCTPLHWARLTRPAAILADTLLLAILLDAPEGSAFLGLVRLGILAALGYFLYQCLEWRYDYFEVTDKRVLLVTGLVTRQVASMPMGKVTDLTYRRPPIGRLLGYGTFVFESAGQEQALHTVRFLPCPQRLYQKILDVLFGDTPPAGREE